MKIICVIASLFFFLNLSAQEKHRVPVPPHDTMQEHRKDSVNLQKKKRDDSIKNKTQKTHVDTTFGKPKAQHKDSIPDPKRNEAFLGLPTEVDFVRLFFVMVRENGPDEIQDLLNIVAVSYPPNEE